MSSSAQTNGRSSLPTIGFLGLGAMGGPMARRLLSAGYPLTAYDPNDERLAGCIAAGAVAATSAAEAAGHGEVVLTSLPSSALFVQVADSDLLPTARRGQVFIDMGTTEAPETRRLAAAFARKGAALLDAPVSGAAAPGRLRVFVGGDPAVFARCRPILEVLGDPERIVYCGPSSAGQAVKGVNQLAMGLVNAAFLEAVAFGVKAGADPAAIRQGVGGDEGFRKQLAGIAGRVIDGRADEVLIKFPELPYFLREARARGFHLPLTEALLAFCDAGPRDRVDNMGRPRVAYWHELMNRSR